MLGKELSFEGERRSLFSQFFFMFFMILRKSRSSSSPWIVVIHFLLGDRGSNGSGMMWEWVEKAGTSGGRVEEKAGETRGAGSQG